MSPSGDTVDSAFRRKKPLIFTEKYAPLASSQENNSISFDHGGETDSPEQEVGRAKLPPRLLYGAHPAFRA